MSVKRKISNPNFPSQLYSLSSNLARVSYIGPLGVKVLFFSSIASTTKDPKSSFASSLSFMVRPSLSLTNFTLPRVICATKLPSFLKPSFASSSSISLAISLIISSFSIPAQMTLM
ncbi:115aa long hypothetical protein [Pyrococcus horikoshii OT3]|uniref:Uncharacterized protein n=1 Tax=Pyrococcus horikoshii (strain ATCC 700860 / DSM 12428 / JCM 9974 / NBRC 100139 / OT-3) TaxID=70601 RepID=O57822_PYRHO|nr:115aa long hypothetical protein [Pyrococcus horikoshii OT3]